MLSHFSCVRLCVTLWMAATRLPHPWDSPGKNTSSRLPLPFPGDLPHPGMEPRSPALQVADSLLSEPPGKSPLKGSLLLIKM